MYTDHARDTVQLWVNEVLQQDENLPVSVMAERLALTEGEVTFALPGKMVSPAEGMHCEAILTRISEWGPLTTIVHSFGSIFEFKGPFPKGTAARGYFNMMSDEGFQGHLKLELVSRVAFVSKPLRGTESHYIGFYEQSGHCIFKVYLGRDKFRQLFLQQIVRISVIANACFGLFRTP